jgi:hypothetical protein
VPAAETIDSNSLTTGLPRIPRALNTLSSVASAFAVTTFLSGAAYYGGTRAQPPPAPLSQYALAHTRDGRAYRHALLKHDNESWRQHEDAERSGENVLLGTALCSASLLGIAGVFATRKR